MERLPVIIVPDITTSDIFVVDIVKSGEMKIKYCPIDYMIGEYFNNPIKGAKLRKYQELILNIQTDDDGLNPTSGVDPQECVGYLSYS